MKIGGIALILVSTAAIAQAHPVPFKGAIGVMSWNQPSETENMVTYSFARQAAIAGIYSRMDLEDHEVKYYGPQANILAKRWNGLDHQANLYFVGGMGGYELDERQKTAASGGIEADYETTKVYTSVKFFSIYPEMGKNIYSTRYRAGVSAYPFEYDDLSSWLILELQHNSRMKHSVTLTPLLRLLYKNVLLETGASLEGDWMLNVMFHL